VLRNEYIHEAPDLEWAAPTTQTRFRRLLRSDLLTLAEARGQMEAASGLAQIDPLTDDEVVATVASVPQEALLHDEWPRGLLRHATRQILPESLRLRPDKARFEPAIVDMLEGDGMAGLRELASMRLSAELGLVEPPIYRRHFEAVVAAGAESPDWLAIWPALAVEAFLRSSAPSAGLVS
jgi:hypothetical protein